jgi:uncharacterized protein
MKTRLLLFCVCAGALPAVSLFPQSTTPPYPPHTIAGTELRELPATAQGRAYQLHVALPASYAKEPKKRYPVFFVTDGYWDFATIQSSYGGLVYDRVVPEFIIVGLGYAGTNLDYDKLRRWELSPVPFDNSAEASGHAADFLQTVEQAIIPFVDREYRTDPSYRVLAGSSLGGLFTLYTMYTKPGLFQAYVAASPAVALENDWLFGYEDAFAKSGKPLQARLYMTGAENEWPSFLAGIERFHQRITQRKYAGFVFEYRLIDGERHGGTKPESYTRGMRFAFAPLAPETGRTRDR